MVGIGARLVDPENQWIRSWLPGTAERGCRETQPERGRIQGNLAILGKPADEVITATGGYACGDVQHRCGRTRCFASLWDCRKRAQGFEIGNMKRLGNAVFDQPFEVKPLLLREALCLGRSKNAVPGGRHIRSRGRAPGSGSWARSRRHCWLGRGARPSGRWWGSRISVWTGSRGEAARDRVLRSRIGDDRDHVAHRHGLLSLRQDCGDKAVMTCLDLHHRFVGFHFQQDIAGCDPVAGRLAPGNDQAGILRHAQRRHDDGSSFGQAIARGSHILQFIHRSRGWGWNLVGGFRDRGDRLAHGNVIAGAGGNAREKAVGLSLDFHGRLVGLDFHDGFPGLDRIARLLEPGDDLAGVLRHSQGGHDDVMRHGTGPRGVSAWPVRPRFRPSAR